jgi:hypothetical protein
MKESTRKYGVAILTILFIATMVLVWKYPEGPFTKPMFYLTSGVGIVLGIDNYARFFRFIRGPKNSK